MISFKGYESTRTGGQERQIVDHMEPLIAEVNCTKNDLQRGPYPVLNFWFRTGLEFHILTPNVMPLLFRARLGSVKHLIDRFLSNKPYGKSSTGTWIPLFERSTEHEVSLVYCQGITLQIPRLLG